MLEGRSKKQRPRNEKHHVASPHFSFLLLTSPFLLHREVFEEIWRKKCLVLEKVSSLLENSPIRETLLAKL